MFIFKSFPRYSKVLNYMRFKDFIMKHFILEKVDMHSYVIKQGTKSDKIIVIKQGLFALIKEVQITIGYYQKVKQIK